MLCPCFEPNFSLYVHPYTIIGLITHMRRAVSMILSAASIFCQDELSIKIKIWRIRMPILIISEIIYTKIKGNYLYHKNEVWFLFNSRYVEIGLDLNWRKKFKVLMTTNIYSSWMLRILRESLHIWNVQNRTILHNWCVRLDEWKWKLFSIKDWNLKSFPALLIHRSAMIKP